MATREIFVDAEPRRVVVEEEYHLDQEISEHRSTVWGEKQPRGSIEWQVPYDGPRLRHVARSTAATRRLLRFRDAVVVGRLAVTDHEDTDLAAAAPLGENHDTVALTLPTHPAAFPHGEDLATGRHEARGRVDYRPWGAADEPDLDVFPVSCEIGIDDPDTTDDEARRVLDLDELRQVDMDAAHKLMEHATFRGELELAVEVCVTVDAPRRRAVEPPVVRRVSVELPHLTSADPDSLELRFSRRRVTFQHHAPTRSVEWRDIPTAVEEEHEDDRGNDARRHRFRSTRMRLALGQPGELFDRRELAVHVEVELPGYLLSGTQVKLFDAAGSPVAPPRRPVCRTVVHSTCTVVLDDAFAHRRFSPFQSIFFDELVPEQRRVGDVKSVLEMLGFEVEPEQNYDPPGPGELLSALRGVRGEGATSSGVVVIVRGRRAATHRRSQQGTEHQYSSRLDSGDLTLFVWGWATGDVAQLMRRMNELHRALRERFRPLRSRR
ncbi:hypothetical protein [Actinomycetospora sp. NBRC 106375]|uniref:hypothetical protein n=1 Tax=Actinomycetospora sp. NBRC 106375 TaxID=3032207 RepID=UPI002552978A|nr:hypothetical protein [Actinomycetospora sp. NBRC 106375]